MTILEKIQAFVESIPYSAYIVPAVLAVLALVVIFNGRKLIHGLKFLICAGAGFYAGYALLTPVVAAYLTFLPQGYEAYIVGGVVALLAALLCKFVYVIAFAGAFGYAAWALVIPALVATVPVLANPTYAIVAAVVVAVLALLLRGLIEMAGTAFGGVYGLFLSLDALLIAVTASMGLGAHGAGLNLTDGPALVAGLNFGSLLLIVLLVVLGLPGFVKQVKNRR